MGWPVQEKLFFRIRVQTNDYRAWWESGVRWNWPICQMEFQLERKKIRTKSGEVFFKLEVSVSKQELQMKQIADNMEGIIHRTTHRLDTLEKGGSMVE